VESAGELPLTQGELQKSSSYSCQLLCLSNTGMRNCPVSSYLSLGMQQAHSRHCCFQGRAVLLHLIPALGFTATYTWSPWKNMQLEQSH